MFYPQFFWGNPNYLDVNFDFQKTTSFLLVFLSPPGLAFEVKILAYEAKNSENLNKKSYLCFNPNSHLDSQNIKKDKI